VGLRSRTGDRLFDEAWVDATIQQTRTELRFSHRIRALQRLALVACRTKNDDDKPFVSPSPITAIRSSGAIIVRSSLSTSLGFQFGFQVSERSERACQIIRESGEPHFRELEPDARLASSVKLSQKRGLTKHDRWRPLRNVTASISSVG
jgi:hypothetical protein